MATNDSQRRTLALLPKFTGMTSVVCSSLVAYAVLRDPKKRSSIHYRIILGMAAVDICNSFAHFLSTWPIPKDSGVMYASGNETTCNAQGFFTQFTVTAPLYNVVLSLYYLLVLRYGWTEDSLRDIEPFLHSFPIMSGISTAVMGIPLKLYNNSGFWCWIAPFPGGCEGDDCIRGRNANFYRWAIWYGPAWVSVVFVISSMFLVFGRVLQLSKEDSEDEDDDDGGNANNRADPKDTPQDEGVDRRALLENDPTRLLEAHQKGRRVRRDIAIQCGLYGGSFGLTWAGLTTVRILQTMERPVPYELWAAAAFMTPFQGFLNFMAFFFPRFFNAREANPTGGIREWIKEAL